MPSTRGVRIVKRPGTQSTHNVNVYDLETGEPILNVYRIQIDITRAEEVAKITLTTGDAWEYEGPVDVEVIDEAHAN